jgi:anti-anti-sigma regulatory factor
MTTSLDRQTRPHLRLIRQEEPQMAMSMSTHDSPAPMPAREPNVLYAPERLVAESRTEFRKSALEFVERCAKLPGMSAVTVDLGGTREVDASGLGILVLVQKRAKESDLRLRLRRTPSQVRYLLTLTKLDHLFDFAD